MTALSRLQPRLRDGIADTLRWRSLRPVQEMSIPVILDGHNAVILAPTAGGKTEAAFLPCLDVLAREAGVGVRLLYVSPLVALLNNQEARATRLAGLAGLEAFKWHGGVGPAERKRFLDDPAALLLTTPESLEAMLLGRSVPVRELFSALRFVIVDEVHAFAGSDRGAHLIAVIERLARLSRHDVQRVGLSATVANPGDIGRWLKGSSRRAGRIVRPPGASASSRAGFVWATASEAESLQFVLQRAALGKTLVFTESRADAESIADSLRHSGTVEFTAAYHSAISREARQHAEDAMTDATYTSACLACTSAMELGVDLGDLDDVLQWEPPGSVSSLLQRWGRTGRREGRQQVTTVLTGTSRATLTAAAQFSLAQEGWVELVRPRRRAYHILLQQMLSEVLHGSGHTPQSLWATLDGIPAFADVPGREYENLWRHLVKTNILNIVGGQLVLGDAGERHFGAKRFQALITSFDTPDVYIVVDVTCRYEVGQIELMFVEQLRADLTQGQRPVVLLGGRPWQVREIQDSTGVVAVAPDVSGRPPVWEGGAPRIMARDLAWRHRELLLGHPLPPNLNAAALRQLEALRAEYALLRSSLLPITAVERRLTLHTYAGTRVNTTLGLLLRPFGKTLADAFTVRVELERREDGAAIPAHLTHLRDGLTEQEVADAVEHLRPMRLSKYQPFLPQEFRRRIVADELLDVEDTVVYLKTAWRPEAD